MKSGNGNMEPSGIPGAAPGWGCPVYGGELCPYCSDHNEQNNDNQKASRRNSSSSELTRYCRSNSEARESQHDDEKHNDPQRGSDNAHDLSRRFRQVYTPPHRQMENWENNACVACTPKNHRSLMDLMASSQFPTYTLII